MVKRFFFTLLHLSNYKCHCIWHTGPWDVSTRGQTWHIVQHQLPILWGILPYTQNVMQYPLHLSPLLFLLLLLFSLKCEAHLRLLTYFLAQSFSACKCCRNVLMISSGSQGYRQAESSHRQSSRKRRLFDSTSSLGPLSPSLSFESNGKLTNETFISVHRMNWREKIAYTYRWIAEWRMPAYYTALLYPWSMQVATLFLSLSLFSS